MKTLDISLIRSLCVVIAGSLIALFGSLWYQKKAQTGFLGAFASFFLRLPFSPFSGAGDSFLTSSFLAFGFDLAAGFLSAAGFLASALVFATAAAFSFLSAAFFSRLTGFLAGAAGSFFSFTTGVGFYSGSIVHCKIRGLWLALTVFKYF